MYGSRALASSFAESCTINSQAISNRVKTRFLASHFFLEWLWKWNLYFTFDVVHLVL